MSSTPSPARVLIVGRSAAERSVVAGAFRRAGVDAVEWERGADLTPQSLLSAQMVVALDQHAFLARTLDDAQDYGAAPLFLPIQLNASDAAAEIVDTEIAKPESSRAAASAPTGVSSGQPPPHYAAARIQKAQALANVQPADAPDALRAQFAALAAEILALDSAPAHNSDPGDVAIVRDAEDAAPDAVDRETVTVRDIYHVMPEHDPRNQAPGPLPELETPKSAGWVAAIAVFVVIASAAYLMLAPPTEQERAEKRYEQEQHAEANGLRIAANTVYRARGIATRSPLDLQSEPVTCRRLLEEGRTELAKDVCARAYVHDASAASALAQVLMRSDAAHEALAILELRVQQRPDDLDAWQLLATAARHVGDTARERKAIERQIEIHAHADPTAPLRERLKTLDEASASP